MNLIRHAESFQPGRLREMEMPTNDEIELFVAYLKEEVTARQCNMALGRSYGYYLNWTRRCLWRLYQEGNLTVEWSKQTVVYRRPTYEALQTVRAGRVLA